DMRRLMPQPAQLLIDLVADGLHLPRVCRRTNHEVVSESAGLRVQPQYADVLGLLLHAGLHRDGYLRPHIIFFHALRSISFFWPRRGDRSWPNAAALEN